MGRRPKAPAGRVGETRAADCPPRTCGGGVGLTGSRTSHAPANFLSSGGEMGRLIRDFDWRKTPLGVPQGWPQPLRMAVRLMLTTNHPVCMFWGPDLRFFYNDAYARSIGPERHPSSLGQPARQVWDEVWDVAGPQIEQVMAGGAPTWHENQLVPITRHGRREDVYWTYSYGPIDDADAPNGVGGALVLCTETTAQVVAANERDRLARLFDQAPSFVCTLRGPSHVFDYVNAAHIRLFGSQDWLGKPVREAFPDIAGQGFYEILDRVYETGERYAVNGAPARFSQTRNDPFQDRVLDFVYEPIRDDTGNVVGIFCDGYDVTDRVQAQTALRAQDEQLRLAAEVAEIGLWDVDGATGALFWPPRVKAMFGISPHAPASMDDFYAGLHPEDRKRVSVAYAGAADPARRQLYDVEYRTIGKEDGILRWVAAKGRGVFDADGRCIRVIGTAIDITARKRAAEQLRASQASLAETVATLDALIDHAPIGFAFFDPLHRYARLNEMMASTNGFPVEAHLGRTVEELLPEKAPMLGRLIDEVVTTRQVRNHVEIDGKTPARPGQIRSWLTSFFPVFGVRNEVAYVGVTAIDITARRRAEAALRELNESLEAKVEARTAERDRLWRNSQDLQIIVDTKGMMMAVNPSVAITLGWAPDELRGRSVFDYVFEEDILPSQAALAHATSQALPSFQNRWRHKDGSYRWISWVAAPEDDLVYASGRDVTAERKQAAALAQAEAALRQAQKMEAIGKLTGGIAHDFNNLLQGVAGSLDLIRLKPGNPERVLMWADVALKAVERGGKLTSQVLAFSRSQQLELRPLVVSGLVLGMHDLLNRTLGPSIRVTLQLETDGVQALYDETQLEMAILNLAINARDAMDGSGDLTIKTRDMRMEGDPELTAGNYVELSVSDTGTGMPPDVLARAFDPFFSTKGIGKGTGLGLSQVYGIMRQAGGTARIESRLGAGTTVRLYLPRTETVPLPKDLPVVFDIDLHRRSATVLIVDDDPDLRRIMVDCLNELAYASLEAEDGYAGLAALDRSGPDAMIIDYAMPGITGAEVARQARLKYPELPIILASGYADIAAIEASLGRDTPILRKPFRVEELDAVLAAALRKQDALSRNSPLEGITQTNSEPCIAATQVRSD
jgi:PAS domain S-box-containing protein